MSLLASKFDPQRGYPNGSALAEPFKIKLSGGTPESLPIGTLVAPETQTGQTVVSAATTPDITSADPLDVWLVVEGNDDYSGAYVGKVMAVKCGSGIIWETDSYAAGTYAVGSAVSYSAGVLKEKGATEQIIGYVLDNFIATKGTIRISS